MMTIQEIILWFLMMFPIAYSAGPNNILCALSGGSIGFRKTIPFIIGVNISIMVYSFLAGFGLGKLFTTFPVLADIIRYGGAIYIFWLAWKIYAAAKSDNNTEFKVLDIKDGFVINSLNPKTITGLLLMYSQFLKPDDQLIIKVPFITLLVFLLSIGAHFLWTLAGSTLTLLIKDQKYKQWQSYIFSLMLIGVGIWLILR